MPTVDTIVVGGGLVGSAIATGLAANGREILVLDGSDTDFRASRGNFGLIWVQGKGDQYPPYAHLSRMSAKAWPHFNQKLIEETGVDIGYQQTGGYDFCLDNDEWQARQSEMEAVAKHTNGDFRYEMLKVAELKSRIPRVSGDLVGASYSPQDGHVNPLYLLHALHKRLHQQGVKYSSNAKVNQITANSGGFLVVTSKATYQCERIVLCAGLDNLRLSAAVDIHCPVKPLRGQLLITERVEHFLNAATLQVRQTAEGCLQIGDSHEDSGLDKSTSLDVIERLAARAIRIFPHLKNVSLNRAWGALRIMTPDGMPVYQQSERYPGAYSVSCHSGVTLAASHASLVADWIDQKSLDDHSMSIMTAFGSERFNVSPA